MRQHQEIIEVRGRPGGLTEITSELRRVVGAAALRTGLCTVFVQHTSASLVIQENADPSARMDLERYLRRLAPEGDPAYTHTAEGPDDMPSHLRAALTSTSESIPVVEGRRGLGTWQGLFLWEHRAHAPLRRIVVHVVGD